MGRIASRLGWVPLDSPQEEDEFAPAPEVHAYLRQRLLGFPVPLLQELHYNMISLGKGEGKGSMGKEGLSSGGLLLHAGKGAYVLRCCLLQSSASGACQTARPVPSATSASEYT